jgi:hypothetical protein
MIPDKPTDAPKEGYEYALKTNPKAKGYAEALIDTGMDPVQANEKAEGKYPSSWVQLKIGTSDRKANIQMAINGLIKAGIGVQRIGMDPTNLVKAGIKTLTLEKAWILQENPLKDGGVQMWQGSPVMRWLPTTLPGTVQDQTETVLVEIRKDLDE